VDITGTPDALSWVRRTLMSLDHYANDERQAMLTFALLAIMAVVSVALIAYAVLVA